MNAAAPENQDRRSSSPNDNVNPTKCKVKGCVWRGICPVHDEYNYSQGFHSSEQMMRRDRERGGGRQIQCDYCGRWATVGREHVCAGAA